MRPTAKISPRPAAFSPLGPVASMPTQTRAASPPTRVRLVAGASASGVGLARLGTQRVLPPLPPAGREARIKRRVVREGAGQFHATAVRARGHAAAAERPRRRGRAGRHRVPRRAPVPAAAAGAAGERGGVQLLRSSRRLGRAVRRSRKEQRSGPPRVGSGPACRRLPPPASWLQAGGVAAVAPGGGRRARLRVRPRRRAPRRAARSLLLRLPRHLLLSPLKAAALLSCEGEPPGAKPRPRAASGDLLAKAQASHGIAQRSGRRHQIR